MCVCVRESVYIASPLVSPVCVFMCLSIYICRLWKQHPLLSSLLSRMLNVNCCIYMYVPMCVCDSIINYYTHQNRCRKMDER